ncbi:TetR/AcrR family transcriptional regulator [Hamadaea tsunoensis]|uniref:TetR/AcrR family transcriptional regulator n=1 Tax=Hamadaea tsunoensis TaxID=53368 RepID=UPI00041073BC|nr:TetR/AcrR family transcriptional regulator [Hamadaea tsunoensis]
MPRPRSLTPGQLAVAALAVIDRDGLGGLTMRTVADELGMGTMSIYRYVPDRGQLELLVVDHVMGGIDFTSPDGAWRERIAVICERIRLGVAAHPHVIPLLLVHRQASRGVRASGEALLEILAGAGLDGERRVLAFRALLSWLTGALATEGLGSLAGAGTAALAEQDDYPRLAETARVARTVPAEREFATGLDLVLRGIATYLE